jgi:N-alpha-acetyltransferase 35, NatC auxiliary subunit
MSYWFMDRSNEAFEAFLREDLEELVFPEDQVMDPLNWALEQPVTPLASKDKRLIMAEVITEFTMRALPVLMLTRNFEPSSC